MKAACASSLRTCRRGLSSNQVSSIVKSLKSNPSNKTTLLRSDELTGQFLSRQVRLFSITEPNWNQNSGNHNNNFRSSENKSSSVFAVLASLAGGATLAWLGADYFRPTVVHCEEADKNNHQSAGFVKSGHFIDGLPVYTEQQVLEHNKDAKTIWVSYKEGVYDITEFVQSHPGGDKILMAAGTSIEPFWQIYPVHFNHENFARLEALRIGNLDLKSTTKTQQNKGDTSKDPFANDPKRHPLLKVLSQRPFNAESPKEISVDSLVTPNELHFVRNHLPVPHVDDAKSFKLEVLDATTGKRFSFSLADLATSGKFKIHTIPVTLQCSGNKRKFMNDYEPVQGLMWDVNAISTAEWTGVKLRDVLDYCKLNLADEKIKHVQFEGLDKDPSGSPYGASVPKETVAKETGDVLLAFKMNGVDIPVDHGYPLRVIIPGVAGARSVKWLSRVVLSAEESKSHWQKNDYKLISPSVRNLKEVDFSQCKAIQETSVQSAICQPVDGAKIDKEDGSFVVKGYAFSGGGNSIEKVVVSIDDGRSWKLAQLKQVQSPLYRHWSWTIWECELDIPKDKQTIEILCAATDSQQNSQPETVKGIWNVRGLMNNSWHRIKVELK